MPVASIAEPPYTIPSPTEAMSFEDLEANAVRQWEAIEDCRRGLVGTTFSATESA
jgi:hypothetical protein